MDDTEYFRDLSMKQSNCLKHHNTSIAIINYIIVFHANKVRQVVVRVFVVVCVTHYHCYKQMSAPQV